MNIITVAGQLGKDSELCALGDGTPVCSFSVADSQGRDKPTIWWNCALFGNRATALQQYLLKGQSVTVSGTVSEREWTDKDGHPRKSMDVRVNDVALQGGKPQASQPAPRQAPKASAGGASGFENMDDSIPFRDPLASKGVHLAI